MKQLDLSTDALQPQDAARVVQRSAATLASWRSRGKGPKFIRIMGRIYYKKSDLNDWLNEQINAA